MRPRDRLAGPVCRPLVRIAFGCAAAISVASYATPAAAERPFETSAAIDGAITGTSWATLILLNAAIDKQAPNPSCKTQVCGPLGDGARPYDHVWNKVSYGTAFVALGGAMAPSLSRWADGDGSASDTGSSTLVLAEAVGITAVATELTKIVVPRYRPFLAFPPQDGGASRSSPDANASFWSGHSALTFAAAAIGSFDACRSDSPLGCAAPAIGLHAFAAATAWGRVLAGKHHTSDVLVGSAVGSGIGALVAMLHAPAGRERGRAAGQTVAGAQVVMLGFAWAF